ncbi:MAG: glycoside hydrolase [Armatimonadota bacterium]
MILPSTETSADAFAVTVSPRRRRQVIENFGASGCWTMDPLGETWGEADKNRIADLLFSRDKGIGLSLWRFNIGAGDPKSDGYWQPWRRVACFKSAPDAPYDWTRQAGQQWFLRAAKTRGVENLLAFTNSPPAWMTVTGRAFGDDSARSTNLKPGAESAFGTFLTDVLTHFRREGLPFQYISPMNEPCWDWKGGQEGCRYNNDDIKRVARAVGAALKKARLDTHLDIVDNGDIRMLLDDDLYARYTGKPGDIARMGNEAHGGRGKYREGLRDLLGDREIQAITGPRFSCHSYWTADRPHDLQNLRQLLRRNLERYAPGAIYWQSEFCVMEHGRDLGMDTALRVAALIHHDLVYAEASAWHWWLAVSPGDYKDGLIYTDFDANRPEGRAILPSKTLWALGNWSRFVRPGARRLELDTAGIPDELLVSAYHLERERRSVVVAVNRHDAPHTLSLRLDDAPRGSRISVFITDATRDLSRVLQPVALSLVNAILVPPRAVVTVEIA